MIEPQNPPTPTSSPCVNGKHKHELRSGSIFDTTSGRLGDLRSQVKLESSEASAISSYLWSVARPGPNPWIPSVPSVPSSAGWPDYQTLSATIKYELARRRDAASMLEDDITEEMLLVIQDDLLHVAGGLEGATTRKIIMDFLGDLVVIQKSLSWLETQYITRAPHDDPSLPPEVLDFRIRTRQTIQDAVQRAKELHVQAIKAYQHLP